MLINQQHQRTSARGLIRALPLAMILLGALCHLALAQQPAQPPPASPAPAKESAAPMTDSATQAPAVSSATPAGRAEYRYRIGPGDVLDIRIFNRVDFSREATVDPRGYIRMPLIKDEIRAACRTEVEFAADIAEIYRKYLKSPHVDVFVKQFNSEPVAIIGAVNSPSRFQLQRPVRLLELIVAAGGPAPRAGRTIQVVHSAHGIAYTCDDRELSEADAAAVKYLPLASTLKAEEQSNPLLRPGDLVSIADADQAFVVGNVRNPTTLSLNEPLTISRAIGMAGGLLPETKKSKVRILRQPPGSSVQTEMYVDLAAIEKKKAPDEQLHPNDIVEVPTESGAIPFLKRIATQGIIPSIATLPLRVIP